MPTVSIANPSEKTTNFREYTDQSFGRATGGAKETAILLVDNETGMSISFSIVFFSYIFNNTKI